MGIKLRIKLIKNKDKESEEEEEENENNIKMQKQMEENNEEIIIEKDNLTLEVDENFEIIHKTNDVNTEIKILIRMRYN